VLKYGNLLTVTACHFEFAVSFFEFTPHPESELAPLQYVENKSPAVLTNGEHYISVLVFSWQSAVTVSFELQHVSYLVTIFKQYLASYDLYWHALQSKKFVL
jgi:hypothetical protein